MHRSFLKADKKGPQCTAARSGRGAQKADNHRLGEVAALSHLNRESAALACIKVTLVQLDPIKSMDITGANLDDRQCRL